MSGVIASPAACLYLRLAQLERVGPRVVRRLVDALGGIEQVMGAPAARLAQVRGLSAESAERIARQRNAIDVRPLLEEAGRLGLRVVCFDDGEYPAGLRRIPDPPIVLYVRGRLEPRDVISIAVVGARQCSIYGQEQARRFGELLASAGFTVVSGLARGIDAFAHHGALDAGGRTVAVFGCGLGQVYPPENRALAERIIETDAGAWLSELPPAASPQGSHFPARNRIIAGMTLGTLIVEASSRSGALITARLAGEYNRELFAVPGRVQDPMSIGTNRLISEGSARLVTCLEDILDELRPLAEALLKDSLGGACGGAGPAAGRGVDDGAGVGERAAPPDLSPIEQRVLAAVSDAPRYTDVIAHKANLSIAQVLAALTALELRGLISRLPGHQVVRASPRNRSSR